MAKTRIVIIQGSPRSEDNCPDQNSKTRLLVDEAIKDLPDHIETDLLDLAITSDDDMIPNCKGCVGTAGGYHCHFPCSCYGPGSGSSTVPDLMHNQDVYGRLKDADGFIVFTPIHWYDVSAQVKSMFDRLVCASMSLTVEDAEKLGIGKDAEISRNYAKDGRFDDLRKNHLEGRFAGFFAHGDDGGNDFVGKKLPQAHRLHEDHEKSVNEPRAALMRLAAQCRYSGIYVSDNCIVGYHINREVDYATANDTIKSNERLFKVARDLILRLDRYIKDGKPV